MLMIIFNRLARRNYKTNWYFSNRVGELALVHEGFGLMRSRPKGIRALRVSQAL